MHIQTQQKATLLTINSTADAPISKILSLHLVLPQLPFFSPFSKTRLDACLHRGSPFLLIDDDDADAFFPNSITVRAKKFTLYCSQWVGERRGATLPRLDFIYNVRFLAGRWRCHFECEIVNQKRKKRYKTQDAYLMALEEGRKFAHRIDFQQGMARKMAGEVGTSRPRHIVMTKLKRKQNKNSVSVWGNQKAVSLWSMLFIQTEIMRSS